MRPKEIIQKASASCLLDRFRESGEVTFVAYIETVALGPQWGEWANAYLPSAIKLIFIYSRGLCVETGVLDGETPSSSRSSGFTSSAEVEAVLAKLPEPDYEFAVGWHVLGEREVHFRHQGMDKHSALDAIKHYLADEVINEL